ncbi:ImmA/IrrE family metallo-endopeptidase [Komarekiella sp. 'clone 1']|uniref:ImmA/IrrE family metallo-endopeptidase n=1 Tax=Komarekiella delphini-convector SJRDD-AB1 TaxID=2593771 RepID=A0AA40SVE8_9NOST|nr:XRE family transcriptional regulator [Komarekiella delphini-convector]MBD6616001.1 ImmA/IrrE family metallo-endopeptidase [Komarekiella delphini-convector SJRDD-AB1]
MSFDLALFSSKLRRCREQFEKSLVEVTIATGIPENILVALENGERQPTGDEVLIFADYYLCDYQFFISNERVASFDQTETLFRRYGEEFSKEDRWAVQEFLFLCECEDFLLKLVSTHIYKPFSFIKRGNYYIRHGKEAAKALRKHLGYASNAIRMDVYEDFRSLGFHIFRRQLGNSNISGLFIKHPTAGKCILVNYSEDIYRQRFTAAHESAHGILDDDQEFVISLKTDKKNLVEVRANNFASNYLMPPEFLQKIPDYRSWNTEKAIEWANKLKVSTEALANALKSANFISKDVEIQIKAVRVPRHLKVDPELPESLSSVSSQRRKELLKRGLSNFYVGLCFDVYEQGFVSAGRVAEMLLISKYELTEIASIYGRTIRYGD